MYLLIIFSSIIPLVSLALSRHVERAKFLALIVFLPAILTLYDFATGSVTTLGEWYWVNKGIPIYERLMAALTMPTFLIPLLSLILIIIAIRERVTAFYIISSVLIASLLFHWSIYLNLNYPMILRPPSLEPLGYAVLRSSWFFIYLPLVMASIGLLMGYLVTMKKKYRLFSATLAFVSAFASTAWAHTAYGVPIPADSYHISLYLYPLLIVALSKDLLSKISLLADLLTFSVLPRLYPAGFGGMANPFFAVQTSIALSLLVLYGFSFYEAFRGVERRANVKLALLYLSALLLFGISLADFSLSVSSGSSIGSQNLIYAFATVLIMSAFNLSLVVYLNDRDKAGLLGPLGLLTPWTALVEPFAFSIYEYFRRRKFFVALMVLAALSYASALIYGSWIFAYVHYPFTYKAELGKGHLKGVEAAYKYRGNLTALKELYVYNATLISPFGSKTVVPMGLHYYVNIYMGKYIPPNEPAYFTWSEVKWYGPTSCAITFRPTPIGTGVKCVPLAVMAYLAPLFGLATVLVALRNTKSSASTEVSERALEGSEFGSG